jgi:hypothetical protein
MLPILLCGSWIIGICMVDLSVEYSEDKAMVLEFFKLEFETPLSLLGFPLLIAGLGLTLFYQMVFYSGYLVGMTFVVMYFVHGWWNTYVTPAEKDMMKMDPADPMFNETDLDIKHWYIARGDIVMMIGASFSILQSCFCMDAEKFFHDTELERWKRKQKRFKEMEDAQAEVNRKKEQAQLDNAAAQ